MIVVVGDSHTGPLGRAIDGEGDAILRLKRRFGTLAASKILPGYKLRAPFFEAEGNGLSLGGGLRKVIAEMTLGDGAFRSGDGNLYGFSMGFHTALLLRQGYWRDFSLLPEVEDKAFVTYAVFREMVLADNLHVLAFARALVERRVNAFLLAGAPIRTAMIERQAEFAGTAELLAIDRRYREIMEAELDLIGMPFLPSPAEAMDERGVLRADYDGMVDGDVHHGNVKFGQLQWKAIAGRFASPETVE